MLGLNDYLNDYICIHIQDRNNAGNKLNEEL